MFVILCFSFMLKIVECINNNEVFVGVMFVSMFIVVGLFNVVCMIY